MSALYLLVAGLALMATRTVRAKCATCDAIHDPNESGEWFVCGNPDCFGEAVEQSRKARADDNA